MNSELMNSWAQRQLYKTTDNREPNHRQQNLTTDNRRLIKQVELDRGI